jgi:hypothetical protein
LAQGSGSPSPLVGEADQVLELTFLHFFARLSLCANRPRAWSALLLPSSLCSSSATPF